MERTVGIVLAAGKGERARGSASAAASSDTPKQFRAFRGRPLVFCALELFENSGEIDDVVFVGPAPCASWPALPFSKIVAGVVGGDSRPESVRCALAVLPAGAGIVVVHDAVRPNASAALLSRVVAAARSVGAAVPAVGSRDTVKRVWDGRVVETIARESIRLVQTPQAFQRSLIEEAYQRAALGSDAFAELDDAAVV